VQKKKNEGTETEQELDCKGTVYRVKQRERIAWSIPLISPLTDCRW